MTSTSQESKGATLTEVLQWCQKHPFDFEELVVQKATSTAISRWHETRSLDVQKPNTSRGGDSKADYTRKSVFLGSTAVPHAEDRSIFPCVELPDDPDVAVDPYIVRRVSELVCRHVYQGSVRTSAPLIQITKSGKDLSSADGDNNQDAKIHIGIFTLAQDICQCLDMHTVGHMICRDIPLWFDASECLMYLRHQTHNSFIQFSSEGHEEVPPNELTEFVLSTGSTVCASRDDDSLSPVVEGIFNRESDLASVLAVPLHTQHGNDVGVIIVYRRHIEGQIVTFGDDEINSLTSIVPFCATAIQNAQTFEQALLECRWSNVLLDLSRTLFQNLESEEKLITQIMVNAAAFMACERCSIFMVDDEAQELYAKVFDACPTGSVESLGVSAKEVRFPIHTGIAGHVAQTGDLLNITDAYEDARFNTDVDKLTGFTTRSILCMPITDGNHNVVGVAQLVNKRTGVFTKRDEKLFDSFAVYCGLSLAAVKMYEEKKQANAKHCVALDVLSYHATASDEDTQRVAVLPVPTERSLKLNEISLNVNDLTSDDTVVACVRMFVDSGLVHVFRLPYMTLCRWLLSVKKNYRNVTYHNWKHAFNVTQTVYVILRKAELQTYLTPLERLALIIACLSHDLDHRGTNNKFEGLKKSNLYTLYGTSTMECHHFEMCVTLLNSDGNNILVNLSVEDYKKTMSYVKAAIMATDLSTYLKTRDTYASLVQDKVFEWKNDDHRRLFRSMLMTASDLSAVVRPWEIQRKVAETVYNEFYQQGEAERNIGFVPEDLYDATTVTKLPKMQVGFIDFICKPIYLSLSEHFPALVCLLRALETNRSNWDALSKEQFHMEVSAAKNGIADDAPSNSSLLQNNILVSAKNHLRKRRCENSKQLTKTCTVM